MLLIQRANIATTIYETVPVAQPEAEAWPVDDHPLGIQADEMFARQLDTGFAAEVGELVKGPATGATAKTRFRPLWAIERR